MVSTGRLEIATSMRISSPLEMLGSPTGASAIVSPTNSAPASPTPTKDTLTAADKLSSAASSKSIEDIQSEFSNDVKRKLPDDFEPSESSVICGRGKECFDSEGNKRFRVIITKFLKEYTETVGKSDKSKIVTKAMGIIRERSPQGAFVKKEKGQWYEVSPRYAREKVGAWFRDSLSNHYKSSSKAKHAKKMSKRISYGSAMQPPRTLSSGPFLLVDPKAVFNFPKNFAAQIKDNDLSSGGFESSLTGTNQAFYDIDDLSLIPFDSVDF